MIARPEPTTVRIDGPWAHRDVYANGIRLHVAETGDGPLVLFLHGFAEFWWSWRHQLTALADAGYRAAAVDLRGYGDSDKPPRGYDAWTLAGDVAGLIKSLGEDKAHLVGHAWGGLLGWTVGAMHPRVVHTVTAIAGPHPMALRSQVRRSALRRGGRNQARALGHVFRAQVPMLPERWLTRDGAATVSTLMTRHSGPQWTESAEFSGVVAKYRNAMLVSGVAHSALEYYRWALRAQLRGEGRRFSEAMRRRLNAPVLQLRGALDPCILAPAVEASAPWAARGHRLITMDGVGHYPHQEAPAATSKAIVDFLS